MCVCVGVKVGDELVTAEGMTLAEQDMIQIESILKTRSSVDVTVRSVRAEPSANQQSSSSSRPPGQLSLPPPAASQQNQVVQVAVATSAELASNSASAGMSENKHQHNLVKRGIVVACPPNSSSVFARWQHRTDGLAAICSCMFWLGVRPPNLPFPWGSGTSI